MKHLVESIQRADEAREIEYRVSVIDVTDGEHLPVTITMLCPISFQKKFEQWLEDQQDNAFAHAEGGNVEY